MLGSGTYVRAADAWVNTKHMATDGTRELQAFSGWCAMMGMCYPLNLTRALSLLPSPPLKMKGNLKPSTMCHHESVVDFEEDII